MLEQVLRYLRNWFDIERRFGTFTIEGGAIALPSLQNGQYFRIIGSVFNDGVHQYPTASLVDETFRGAVWLLAVPNAVIELTEEICKWEKDNHDLVMKPYQSESFGGYSYSMKADAGGGLMTWEKVFKHRLNQWRKI